MEIAVVRPKDLSAADREAWSAFQRTSRELDSPFLSPDWALAVEAAEGETSSARVAIFHEGGQSRGFLPLAVPHQTARPLGGPMCDYQAIIGEPGLKIDAKTLMEALAVPRFDFANMLRSQSCFVPYFKGTTPTYAADVSHGFDNYARGMDGDQGALSEVARSSARLERELGPLSFKALSRSRRDFDQLVAWRGEPMPAWVERLVGGLFMGRGQAFGGALYTLHAGDRLIAAQFHLRGQRTLHAWLCGADRRHASCSPGLVLSERILRWMDETPYETIDFGVGGAFAARPLCNSVRNVGVGSIAHPSPAHLLSAAAAKLRSVAGAPLAAPARAAIGALRALR